MIIKATVSNNARSTNTEEEPTKFDKGVNDYACDDTLDRVFLLSMQEVTNSDYGFSGIFTDYDIARRKKSTDYAQSQGCYVDVEYSDGISCWWMRTPWGASDKSAEVVYYSGAAGYAYDTKYNLCGVVPAMRITRS